MYKTGLKVDCEFSGYHPLGGGGGHVGNSDWADDGGPAKYDSSSC